MKTRSTWALVAQRELSVRLRDKTFLGSTLLSLVILIAVFGFQIWQSEGDTTYDLAVTPQAVAMGEQIADRAAATDDSVTVELTEVADADEARAEVREETVDAWLSSTDEGWQLTGLSEVDRSLTTLTQSTVADVVMADNAEQAGTDLQTLQAGSAVAVDVLDGDADESMVGDAVGFAMAFLFYIAAVMFGTYLAMSVTEEKQSRIVEIIATSTSLRQLLIGKLVAAVVLAMLQLALYAVVAVIGVSFTEWGDMLPTFTAGLAWFLVFFVTGFTMIAALFAVAGSLASRQEDVQSTAMPVTVLTMVMFFGALFVEGRIAAVLAWLPPFSAILQPMRLVSGEGEWWQALISLGLLVVATAAVLVLAERIYRRALMQTSGKLTVRQAWKAEV